MILYFLRHASAGEGRKNPKKDEVRPLDAQGIEQCGEVGRALASLDATVDVLISSPLKRATQTASLVGNEIGYEGKLYVERSLRPEATYENFRDMLRKYAKADSVMLVGHNPNLSEFLGKTISPRGSEAYVDLKKGAVSRVETQGKYAIMQWCFTPRMVRIIADSGNQSSSTHAPEPVPRERKALKPTPAGKKSRPKKKK
jgi:phosphohistidine phosphatase